MLDKKDAQWWVLEVEKRPDAAADLIRMLADRLAFMDKQNEELRGEVIALKRRIRGSTTSVEVGALQRRIQELESLLREGSTNRRVIVYGPDRVEINQELGESAVLNRALTSTSDDRLRMLACTPGANLFILTADTRAFFISYSDLPTPESGGDAARLGNPRDVAAIMDRAVFEHNRFLLLVSQRGYVYSLLAGTINAVAGRQEKLIRNLIPGDPIVNAIPAQNGDLIAFSERGRWTRFPERAIAGSGSLIMELPRNDSLVSVLSLVGDAELVFLSADGRLFVRRSDALPPRKAPGVSAGQLFKSQILLGAAIGTEFAILTQHGQVIHATLKAIRDAAASENGMRVPDLAAGDVALGILGL